MFGTVLAQDACGPEFRSLAVVKKAEEKPGVVEHAFDLTLGK